MKNFCLTGVIGILLGLLCLSLLLSGGQTFGNTTESFWDTALGYRVDGTEVISGSFPPELTVASGTFSGNVAATGTMTITGESNLDTLIYGGDKTTLTTATGTVTITAAEICDSSVMAWTWGVLSGSTTLPSSSTVMSDCLLADGDTKNVLFYAATSGASYTTLVAPSAAVILIGSTPSSTALVQASRWVQLTLLRPSSTHYIVEMTTLWDMD